MSESKQVVVFPRGQLSERDRKALQRAGAVVVEADDPSRVVSVLPSVPMISGDDMLGALLESVGNAAYDDVRSRFAKSLWKRFAAKHPPDESSKE